MFTSHSDNFFGTLEFCNKLCGAWMESGYSTRSKKIFYVIYDATLFLFGIFFYVLQVLMLRTTIKDLKQFFRHIGVLSAHLIGLLNVIVIMVNHKKLAKIKEQLQGKDFIYEPCGSFNANKQTAIAKRTCHRFVIVIYILYYMVGGSAHITALWKLNSEQKGKYFDKNATCYDFMPYFFVIPFDTEKTESCRYAFILMDAGFSVLGLYLAAYDALFCSLLICLRTKLEIVCEATRILRKRVISKLALPENFDPFRDEELPTFESEMYAEIKRCNLHLALLLRTCEEIENVFSLVTLVQVITSLCKMASNLFVLSLMEYTDPEFFPLVQYISAVMCQLSMVCYFGSCVTEASINYRRCLYECDWLSGSKRFKVCILIMLCRLEKPLYLTAGKFFPLTLGTVISVLRTSCSYAAMYKAVG